MQVNYQQDRPAGYCQASITTATALSAMNGGTIPPTVTLTRIIVEGAAVRYRDDGTAPTATVGQPLAIGVELLYTGAPNKLQFIPQTGTAVVNASFYTDK